MTLRIGSNIASLRAQRLLGENSSNLSRVYERLSSGLRINRASDDAAGLAVATSLESDARVYGQGIRNLNDGISVLNIAQSALEQLSTINTRQLELAEQAANGALSVVQRRALNTEANSLVQEFNRIVGSTKFGNLQLLNGSISEISLQAGFGQNGSISYDLADALTHSVGTGGFGTGTNIALSSAGTTATGDFNRDGNLDIIDSFGTVLLGNGNGTFSVGTTATIVNRVGYPVVADLNGDGFLDVVGNGSAAGGFEVLIGHGDGTFNASVVYQNGLTFWNHKVGDINGDGVLDIVAATSDNTISVLYGNGNGTFQARVTVASGVDPRFLSLVDMNGDNRLDIVYGTTTGSNVSVQLGTGNAASPFGSVSTYGSGMGGRPYSIMTGDINGDGYQDVIAAEYENTGYINIYFGQSNGSLVLNSTFQSGGNRPLDVTLTDVNGDGLLDLSYINKSSNSFLVWIGNGNGTFSATTSLATPATPVDFIYGDFNSDGVPDVVFSSGAVSGQILLANTQEVTTMPYLDILTQSTALDALATIRTSLDRVTQDLGSIGAAQSRVEIALENLRATQANYLAAASRITDADIAQETAEMVRLSILQDASSAILLQANQEPSLVLKLLSNLENN